MISENIHLQIFIHRFKHRKHTLTCSGVRRHSKDDPGSHSPCSELCIFRVALPEVEDLLRKVSHSVMVARKVLCRIELDRHKSLSLVDADVIGYRFDSREHIVNHDWSELCHSEQRIELSRKPAHLCCSVNDQLTNKKICAVIHTLGKATSYVVHHMLAAVHRHFARPIESRVQVVKGKHK